MIKGDVEMIKKPEMIQDDFMGDYYLGCPNCKEPINFPLFRNEYKPKKCSKCGVEFDWDEKKGNKDD